MCKSEQMMSCDCGHRGIKLEIADIILSPISLRVTAAILGFFTMGTNLGSCAETKRKLS